MFIHAKQSRLAVICDNVGADSIRFISKSSAGSIRGSSSRFCALTNNRAVCETCSCLKTCPISLLLDNTIDALRHIRHQI